MALLSHWCLSLVGHQFSSPGPVSKSRSGNEKMRPCFLICLGFLLCSPHLLACSILSVPLAMPGVPQGQLQGVLGSAWGTQQGPWPEAAASAEGGGRRDGDPALGPPSCGGSPVAPGMLQLRWGWGRS